MLIKGGRAVDWYHRYTIGYSGMDIWDLWTSTYWRRYNILKAIQYGRHFSDDIFKCISLNENIWISLKLSLKCVPKVPIDHIPACDIYQWRIYASFGLNELTKLQIAIKLVSSAKLREQYRIDWIPLNGAGAFFACVFYHVMWSWSSMIFAAYPTPRAQ